MHQNSVANKSENVNNKTPEKCTFYQMANRRDFTLTNLAVSRGQILPKRKGKNQLKTVFARRAQRAVSPNRLLLATLSDSAFALLLFETKCLFWYQGNAKGKPYPNLCFEQGSSL